MRSGLAAEYAVLGVLAPGGLLTVDQLASNAGITTWAARAAVARLERRGLIVDAGRRGRWSITVRGRGAWVAKGSRFTP
ncbi:MarR family transcriptional regulator [Nocardia sp. CDC160]|uniref:MarR family transcriptional regulator n=1 Tax=Nocardia sp. CDC160 TaxID=3112166 RepID=UPI002DB74586|nr:helix-turn-helix domain-containing protein [Nocardia sp. CDC160]MEC3918910.1 helix-turn-helix domain-containing protein [Nocardia sp. CDC160]